MPQKLLLIGWEAADWKRLNPLLDSGVMPNLEKLVSSGVMGKLSSLLPDIPPMLWSSIATGKRAFQHGVYGYHHYDAETGLLQAVSGVDCQCPAIWDILSQNGLRCHVLGWWPSPAAEAVNGDIYTVNHPATAAETSQLHATALSLLQQQEWDFIALYDNSLAGYDGDEPQANTFSQRCKLLDDRLGELLALAGVEATILLCSDLGGQTLPNQHLPPLPEIKQQQFGLIAINGPAIKQDSLIFGCSLLDIAPTLLTLFNLPIGRDMPGAMLQSAFKQPQTPNYIDSWDSDTLSTAQQTADATALQRLLNSSLLPPACATDQDYQRELQYNLAYAYIDNAMPLRALGILQPLARQSTDIRIASLICHCQMTAGQLAEAETTLINLSQQSPADDAVTAGIVAWLHGQLLSALGRPLMALKAYAEALQTLPYAIVLYKQGHILLNLRRWHEAEQCFLKIRSHDPQSPLAYIGLCRCHLSQQRWQEALTAASTGLGLIYVQPILHYYSGYALSKLHRPQEAISAYRSAVAQAPHFIRAHLQLARLYWHTHQLGLSVTHRNRARELAKAHRQQS
jgi:tetratricopeptide (TPR) repeat protein